MHGGDIYSNRVDIDFSVNLNPYKMDKDSEEKIRSAMLKGMDNAHFYPDPAQKDVRGAIARANDVDPGCVYAGELFRHDHDNALVLFGSL